MRELKRMAVGLAMLMLLSAVDIGRIARGAGGGPERPDAPAVLINEVLPAPRTAFKEEFIELFNAGGSSVDLGGWRLDDVEGGGSRPYTIPNGTSIAPLGFAVFRNSTTHIALNNEGDTVRLLRPDGLLQDEFVYLSTHDDRSWGRVPDGCATWQELSRPTPGSPNPAPRHATPAERRLLLTQVYYHAFPKRADEFVAVSNPTDTGADLSGWMIADNDGHLCFPDGTTLGPGRTMFVTCNATDFLSDMGQLPDMETSGSRPEVPGAVAGGRMPSLPDDGGWVALEDATGDVIDLFSWGQRHNGTGWTGPPAGLLDTGEVARRALDGAGGWVDTDACPDWPSDRATVVGRTDMAYEGFAADWVKTFVSPDCSFDVIAAELDSARSSILAAIYQFESMALAGKLARAQERGVQVRVLLEGYPVGGITDQERAAVSLLADSGASIWYIAPDLSAGLSDRYSFMHAKYCVVDGLDCIVVSENWKNSGIPPDPTYGNRGWGVIVRSRGLAAYLGEVFERDSNPAFRDIFRYSRASEIYGQAPPFFVPDTSAPRGNYSPRFKPAVFQGGIRVFPVLSPDTAALPDSSVLAMMASAERTLYVEELSCALDWNTGRQKHPNRYLDAVVEAARRGVEVKVLLDGTYLDPAESAVDNTAVMNYLRYIAWTEGLDLQVRLAAIPGTLKLHNKGLVVDGEKALVSSINWGGTSVLQNREVGVIIEGEGPAGYYNSVFLMDWGSSAINATGPPGDGRTERSDPLKGTTMLLLPVIIVAAMAACLALGTRMRRMASDYAPPPGWWSARLRRP